MEFRYLQYLLFLAFVAVYCYHRCVLKKKYYKTDRTKPAGFSLLGDTPEYLKNRHNFLEWSAGMLKESPGNTFLFRRPGTAHGIVTANPAVVEHILKTNFDNYPKGRRFTTLLQEFLGQGIFNVDGELWKVQRKTASYEFNTKSLRNFIMDNVAVEIKERLIPVLKNASSAANQVLDLQDIFERFAFDNICKLAFNYDTKCLGGEDDSIGKEFMRAFDEASNICSERFMGIFEFTFKVKRFFNLGSERRLKKSVSTVHKFAENIISSRLLEKRDGKNDEDLLSRFIGHEENSPEFLRDIIISFILAGRDTTSSTMSWFFWLLSSNPRVKEKILEELKAMRAKSNKDIGEAYSFDEIRNMHYLHAALTETMRLYPPVPFDSKAVLQDDVLPDGTFVGKGWFITYTAYGMGRMEVIWGENCDEFVPERWLENGAFKPESPFRYPIFHAGPRMCLGKDMAYIQMKSVAAAVLEMFEFDVLETPVPLLSLTLRMKRGMPVRVKKTVIL